MDCAMLCAWLGSSDNGVIAASPQSLAELRAHGVDGRALLAMAADPFCPDGLQALGLVDSQLRQRLLEAAASHERCAAAEAAREWEATVAAQTAEDNNALAAHIADSEEPDLPLTDYERNMRKMSLARRKRRAAALAMDAAPPVVHVGYKIEELGDVNCMQSIFFARFKVWVASLLRPATVCWFSLVVLLYLSDTSQLAGATHSALRLSYAVPLHLVTAVRQVGGSGAGGLHAEGG